MVANPKLANSQSPISVAIEMVSGDGDSEDLPEYRCVGKLRRRRLLTFLCVQRYHHAYSALLREMDEFLDVERMAELVMEGEFDDALHYLFRFKPQHPGTMSLQARFLLRFLHMHRFFAKLVAGDDKDDASARRMVNRYANYYHCHTAIGSAELRIRSITLSMLSPTVRASLDWDKVRKSAAEKIPLLASLTPELQRHLIFRRFNMNPHNVLPIGFRNPSLASFRQRRPVKKQGGRRPSKHALARAFHYIKTSRLSNPEKPGFVYSAKEKDLLADMLDRTLISGQRREYYHDSLRYPLKQASQQSGKEGVTFTGSTHNIFPSDALGAPVTQAMCGSLTGPAKEFSISSVTNAGSSGTPVSQMQTMLGILTDDARKCGNSSITNAGTNKHQMEESTTVENGHDPKSQLGPENIKGSVGYCQKKTDGIYFLGEAD